MLGWLCKANGGHATWSSNECSQQISCISSHFLFTFVSHKQRDWQWGGHKYVGRESGERKMGSRKKIDFSERWKKEKINTRRRHSKRNIADTNLREGRYGVKGIQKSSKRSAKGCAVGTTATDVLWISPAQGMQPVSEAWDGDPCNLIPCGTSISLVVLLPHSTPSAPCVGTMSLLGASEHSNQTRIAGGRNALALAPRIAQ